MTDTAVAIADHDAARNQVRAVMAAEGLTQAAIAREADVNPQTFNLWLNDKYQGHNDPITEKVRIWLASREEKKRVAAVVPAEPDFVQTRSAAGFATALRFAQLLPEISVIAGAAGIGKTKTARHYAATNPNVWLATMRPSTAGVNLMLQEIAAAVRVDERSAAKLARAIGRRISGTGGLIIIDEAQHLRPDALDELRSLYDAHDVGIALVGNETVYARLEGRAREASFAQLFSRVGHRVTQAKPRTADIDALIRAWGVSDPDEVAFLRAVARKPGALRNVTKCLRSAGLLAGRRARTLLDMQTAWASQTAGEVSE